MTNSGWFTPRFQRWSQVIGGIAIDGFCIWMYTFINAADNDGEIDNVGANVFNTILLLTGTYVGVQGIRNRTVDGQSLLANDAEAVPFAHLPSSNSQTLA